MPKDEFTEAESQAGAAIAEAIRDGHRAQAVDDLRRLKDDIHAAIPGKQRLGRGITWVVQRIAALLAAARSGSDLLTLGLSLADALPPDDLLLGVPIFVMGEYGREHPAETYAFFERMADSPDWIVREFAQAGFRPLLTPQRETVRPWLEAMAADLSPNRRRFVAETLRPVTSNRWMTKEPEYSLGILRRLFRESHPYPRTSVGNNLSDLSRRQPELIYASVQELMASQNPNSAWIAYRACRNLVKSNPQRVMDVLGIEEYHYKDRNYYKSNVVEKESK